MSQPALIAFSATCTSCSTVANSPVKSAAAVSGSVTNCCISSASVITTPSKLSASRSIPLTILGDSVAGQYPFVTPFAMIISSSISGKVVAEIITISAPPSMAAR